MGEDFACSPILASKYEIESIKNLNLDIIFSSPDHSVHDTCGGGLYRLNTKSEEITKIYNGKCRGIVNVDDILYVIDMQKGIVVLNNNFDEIDIISVVEGAEPHGLAYNSSTNQLFVGQPGRDSIGVYSCEKKCIVREIFLSKKWSSNKKDNHHINDLLIKNNSLFVSVFSISGNWSNDVYDGGIVEINLLDKEPDIVPVANNVWMPHSLLDWKGGLVFVESMLSLLTSIGWGNLGKFNGFLRGLAARDDNVIIGVSEHKYPERLKNQPLPISIDAGIIVYNVSSKVYKFIRLKHLNSIHSIVIQNG
ncbi:hypothetical protein OAP51_03805 [Alphaproteobacteria bacterium]|nr:hypothetical protein [Alphaproteobacteria bacterium]